MDAENLLKQKVVTYLEQLGLTGEQALAYLFLLREGPQTVLRLSRGLKTGRTKLYPLLEDMANKQLITIHERHYGTSYEAQPPEVLEFFLAEEERKIENLRRSLKAITHALESVVSHSPTTSKIIEYRGVDGLKQMSWNLTKAKKEYRVFELARLSERVGKHLAEKIYGWQVKEAVSSRHLTNEPHWRIDREVPHYQTYAKARFIEPRIFTIEFEVYLYNNCVALLNYEQNDIFGVEIYNPKLARQQKQLFDLLWAQAHEIDTARK